MNIIGVIAGKEVDIKMPGGKIPLDGDIRDIITSILVLDSLSPFRVDGKIVKIIPSKNVMRVFKIMDNEKENYFNENIKPHITSAIGATIGGIISFTTGMIASKIFSKK